MIFQERRKGSDSGRAGRSSGCGRAEHDRGAGLSAASTAASAIPAVFTGQGFRLEGVWIARLTAR